MISIELLASRVKHLLIDHFRATSGHRLDPCMTYDETKDSRHGVSHCVDPEPKTAEMVYEEFINLLDLEYARVNAIGVIWDGCIEIVDSFGAERVEIVVMYDLMPAKERAFRRAMDTVG